MCIANFRPFAGFAVMGTRWLECLASTAPSLPRTGFFFLLLVGLCGSALLGKTPRIYKARSVIADPNACSEYVDFPYLILSEGRGFKAVKEVLGGIRQKADQNTD